MAKKTIRVTISALVEYDDSEFDQNEVESALVICFRQEEKYTDEEMFLPKLEGMEVIDYIDLFIEETQE